MPAHAADQEAAPGLEGSRVLLAHCHAHAPGARLHDMASVLAAVGVASRAAAQCAFRGRRLLLRSQGMRVVAVVVGLRGSPPACKFSIWWHLPRVQVCTGWLALSLLGPGKKQHRTAHTRDMQHGARTCVCPTVDGYTDTACQLFCEANANF